MKIFNILITILSAIVIYIIFKNYNKNKIEKFTTNCTASLTDWKITTSLPSGRKLTDSKWGPLKDKIKESNKDIVSLEKGFKNDLFSDMDNVLDYTIDINDYLEIEREDGSIEYWKPIKKWKEGVVSHFCKELCILKLGYEWIKTDHITGLINLSESVANGGIDETKTDLIKKLIKTTFTTFPPSTYSLSTNEYAELDEPQFDAIIDSSYINDNNYINVDGTNYRVAANMPIGRKWKVYTSYGIHSSQIDVKLDNVQDDYVNYFKDIHDTVSIDDTIILTENDYKVFFTDKGINLTERYVIKPYTNGKVFKPELFKYDNCYQNSCAVFANKEFDNYLKLINLRESMGFKTTSFEYTKEIMNNSDNNLLDLVSKLQKQVNDRPTRGNCSSSFMIDKLIEVIKIGEYVRQDDSTYAGCAKTYDPYTYVKKPRIGSKISYTDICNDLSVKEYRKKINPEIYKYITDTWLKTDDGISYDFEKQWDAIKGDINLIREYGNNALKDKVISKNQLAELIVKYLDDIEYLMHENHRKPQCFWDGYCDGTGIIIKNPNTQQFMDSKNNILDENDIIELYTDKGTDGDIHKWIEVVSPGSDVSTTELPTKLGNSLLNGTREFYESWMTTENVVITLTRNSIYKYNSKYYKYLGLFPRYITMGKIAPDKYIEITSDNIEKVGKQPNSNNITKTQCNNELINKIDENKRRLLDPITESTNTYYENLLNVERKNINNLKQEINDINTNITSTYDKLCSKYDSSDYKLYTKYNLIKFIKNTSLNTMDKIDLNGLAQKTIKLKEISSSDINKKFDKQTGIPTEQCRDNECRNLGNITGDEATILNENINGNEIIISLNDFVRIVKKVNILENDYLLYDTTKFFKIFEIYSDNIRDKINNDFSKESYPDIFRYTYDDFISINIDLHNIDINSSYYIIVNGISYELNMDNTFKKFITNYKSIYQQITDIDLTNTEKCINNEGQNLFADSDAIIKGQNSCTTDNNSCKENIFEKKYTRTQYDNMMLINNENKKSWYDNNYITEYDNIYKRAVGYDLTSAQLNNTYSNYWNNKYHNENQCPQYGDGKQTQVDDLYNVNPTYNYGLKWKKLSSGIDISGKIIIKIYDYDVLNTSLDSNENIIDFTNSQNNIRFKNTQGNIIEMSNITKEHYLMITYIDDYDNEFNNYYEVFGINKCSSSQICSSKSNETNTDDFNRHVENIYSDQEYCNNLNTKYSDRYNPSQKTSFEQGNSFKINNITDLESLLYYPNNYDDNYNLYEFNSVEQTSAPQ